MYIFSLEKVSFLSRWRREKRTKGRKILRRNLEKKRKNRKKKVKPANHGKEHPERKSCEKKLDERKGNRPTKAT